MAASSQVEDKRLPEEMIDGRGEAFNSSTHTKAPLDQNLSLADDLSPIVSPQKNSGKRAVFSEDDDDKSDTTNNPQIFSDSSYNTASYSEMAHFNLYVNKPELAHAKIRKYSEWVWRPAVFVKNADVGVGGKGNHGGYGGPTPSDNRKGHKRRGKGNVSLISRTPTASPSKHTTTKQDTTKRKAMALGEDGDGDESAALPTCILLNRRPVVGYRACSVGDSETPLLKLGESSMQRFACQQVTEREGGTGPEEEERKAKEAVSAMASLDAPCPVGGSAVTASPHEPYPSYRKEASPPPSFSSSSSSSETDDDSTCSERTVGDDVFTSKLYNIPTSGTGPEYFAHRHTDAKKKLLIIMVGLPAQGKTFLAQKLCRLLSWNSFPTQVLNLQVAWREVLSRYVRRSIRKGHHHHHNHNHASSSCAGGNGLGATPFASNDTSVLNNISTNKGPCETGISLSAGEFMTPTSSTAPANYGGGPCSLSVSPRNASTSSPSAQFSPSGCFPNTSMVAFGGNGTPHSTYHGAPTPAQFFREFLSNPESRERKLYTQVLRDHYGVAEQFYKGGGHVMILNDDFPTKALRQEAADLFSPLVDNVMYIEVRRNTQVNLELLKMQGEYSTRTASGMSGEAILEDFSSRIKQMEAVYEPLDPTDANMAYVRLLDSSVLEAHRLTGFLQSRIVSFLMNLTQIKISHPIYFCRHGQSEYNLEDRLGGDPSLTEKGRSDAEALYEFIASVKEDLEDPSHNVSCTPRLLSAPTNPSQPTTLVMECSTAAMYSQSNPIQNGNAHSRVSSGVAIGSTGGESNGSPPTAPTGGWTAAGSSVNSGSEPPHSRSHSAAPNLNLMVNPSATDSAVFSSASVGMLSHPSSNSPQTHALYTAQRRQLQTRGLEVWTSQLRRAIQTAMPAEKRLGLKSLRLHSLNEIHAGVCEDMTYQEVKEQYPLIHRFRGEDKFTFRYPGGESYQDLVARLEPVIMELENANRVVVVVAHQAVLRGLLAYFGSTSADESVHVEVPHRTVWRCTYDAKGTTQIHSVKLGPKEEQQT